MMYELKKSFITIAGLVLLLGAIALAKPHDTPGQNPGSAAATKPSPAPVDVNVVNAPSVVLPSGTTVGIGSFANTVKVDTTNPLPVTDVDNPARHPFAFSVPLTDQTWGVDNATKLVTVHVPDNERLVIEQVSVLALLWRATDQSLRVIVSTRADGHFSAYHFGGTDVSQVLSSDNYIASSLIRMYADPGTDVSIFAIRGNHSSASDTADVNLSGYLVSVP